MWMRKQLIFIHDHNLWRKPRRASAHHRFENRINTLGSVQISISWLEILVELTETALNSLKFVNLDLVSVRFGEMFKLSYFCFVTTVVSLTLLQCTNRICSAVAVDLNKVSRWRSTKWTTGSNRFHQIIFQEIPNLSHNSYSDPSNEFIGIVDDNGGSHVEWVPLQAIGKR